LKILTIYYSYTGVCKKAAEDISKKRNTSLYEVKDKKRPATVAAYTIGCLKALLGKSSPIEAVTEDLSQYDRIVIAGPVWAGNAAPSVNSIIDLLPADMKVEVIMISGSGTSKGKDKMTARIKKRNSTLVRYKDIKATTIVPKQKKGK